MRRSVVKKSHFNNYKSMHSSCQETSFEQTQELTNINFNPNESVMMHSFQKPKLVNNVVGKQQTLFQKTVFEEENI